MKMRKVSIIEVTTFTCAFTEFKGNDWKQAYFNLLSWKNTWDIPLEMDILSTKNHEAYLRLVVERKHEETTLHMLEEYGYIVAPYRDKAVIIDTEEITYAYDDIYDVYLK